MPGSIWLQDVSRGDVPYVVANLVVVGKPREAMRKEEERKGAEMNRNKQQILLVKMAVFIAMTVTQKQGTAMGSPISPLDSDIIIGDLEDACLKELAKI
ncbi:hypothetical protein TKK_0000302 [Trichogramma kaykai]